MKQGEPERESNSRQRDEDTRLMVAFANGSSEAFERLVRRNQQRVFRLAKRYLIDHARAEDITQEVFVRIFKVGRDYRPTAKFSTWTYRITVNLCLNALRDRKGHGEVSLESGPDGSVPDEMVAETVNPGERMASEELSEVISRAVAALPETQRTVLLLRRYEELSYEEIAEVTGKAPSAVKSLLSRARQNLKSMLGQYLGT